MDITRDVTSLRLKWKTIRWKTKKTTSFDPKFIAQNSIDDVRNEVRNVPSSFEFYRRSGRFVTWNGSRSGHFMYDLKLGQWKRNWVPKIKLTTFEHVIEHISREITHVTESQNTSTFKKPNSNTYLDIVRIRVSRFLWYSRESRQTPDSKPSDKSHGIQKLINFNEVPMTASVGFRACSG